MEKIMTPEMTEGELRNVNGGNSVNKNVILEEGFVQVSLKRLRKPDVAAAEGDGKNEAGNNGDVFAYKK